jgi:hypothetical protein
MSFLTSTPGMKPWEKKNYKKDGVLLVVEMKHPNKRSGCEKEHIAGN